jgi:enterochelin esterase family protein
MQGRSENNWGKAMKRLAALSGLLLLATLPLAAQTANQSETVIGPDYKPAPELAIPHGSLFGFTMESADSKIYPGIARIDNETMARRDPWGNRMAAPLAGNSRPQPYSRRVGVYVPPATPRAPGTPPPAMPFMVVQDGIGYMARMIPVLDSLIAAKRIPAIVVIFVNSGGSDAQNSERGLEYDTLDGKYAEFIESEVLPRVIKETGVTFTSDPEGRAAMGGSSGAAAAFTMAWFHSEWYHRVLSYSGTFVNQASPENPATPRGAWEYHATLIPNSPKKPIRIWMEVGEHDLKYTDPEQSWHNWPLANQRMAAALKAKGYDYRFVFARDAMHVDGRVVAQTLPEALEWIWAGYPR